MKLIVVGYTDNLRLLPDCLGRNKLLDTPGETTIVSMNRFTEEAPGLRGMGIIYGETFLKREDYEYMEKYAIDTSEKWHGFLLDDERVSLYRGMKVAEVLELESYISLCTIIKNLQLVLNIVNAINPREVIIIGEKDSDGLKEISQFLNEHLNTRSRYMKIEEKPAGNILIKKVLKNIKRFTVGVVTELLDALERFILMKFARYKKTVIMDYRFPNIIKNVGNEHTVLGYITEKGLKIRLDFVKKRKPYLSFVKMNSLMNGIEGRRYFLKVDNILKGAFTDQQSLRYKGYCIYGVLRNMLKFCIEKRLPLMRSNISMLYTFFNSLEPKAVIVKDSTRSWERALTVATKRLNIPSIVIQHGITSMRDVYGKQHGEAVAFWGDIYREWYQSAGTNISSSKITGYPMHDRIFTDLAGREDRYRKILKDTGADPNKKTVIYLASCVKYYPLHSVYLTPDISLFLLRETLSVFEKFKDLQLIVKLHPFYTREEYPRFKKEISGLSNVFMIENADIPDLFSGSACVISELFSSAIMDAVILKKPVISYNVTDGSGSIPIEERKIGMVVKSREGLAEALHRVVSGGETHNLFSDEKFDSFVKDFAYKIDGRSSERVRNFVNELINERR